MMHTTRLSTLAFFAVALLIPRPTFAQAPAEYAAEMIGSIKIPGTDSDKSGLTDKLGDVPHNRLGGLGSAIAWTGEGNRYALLSDRGPADGAVPFQCRLHILDVTPIEKGLKVDVQETILLRDARGKPLIGSASALKETEEAGVRFDPEGLRVSKKGTYFVSDEYGPSIVEFDKDGKWLRALPVPKRFQVENPGVKDENEKNTSGRQTNAGFEGLALSPDETKLYALMQGPLLQDSVAIADKRERDGVNCRLLEIELASGKTRELVVPLESPETAFCEILAIDDHRFLVLERDHKEGDAAKFKRIYRIDIAEASDVSGVDKLPVKGLPEGQKAVTKSLAIDLLNPSFGIAGPTAPRKIEGLSFGPDQAGRKFLLVTVDNDFKTEVPTIIYGLAIGSTGPTPDLASAWYQDPLLLMVGGILAVLLVWLVSRFVTAKPTDTSRP